LGKALDTFRIIQGSEIWKNYGPWVVETKPQFGPGIKERMDMASSLRVDEVSNASADRLKIKFLLETLVPPGTVLCLPTTASLPPPTTMPDKDMFEYRVKNMSLICLSSLASLPQITIPAANYNGVPVGLSFMGWPGSDEVLLGLARRLGSQCEQWES
jgi:amidase